MKAERTEGTDEISGQQVDRAGCEVANDLVLFKWIMHLRHVREDWLFSIPLIRSPRLADHKLGEPSAEVGRIPCDETLSIDSEAAYHDVCNRTFRDFLRSTALDV